jgi:hypothetical protein
LYNFAIFEAIGLIRLAIFGKTIGIGHSDIELGTQAIGLSDIGLQKLSVAHCPAMEMKRSTLAFANSAFV